MIDRSNGSDFNINDDLPEDLINEDDGNDSGISDVHRGEQGFVVNRPRPLRLVNHTDVPENTENVEHF